MDDESGEVDCSDDDEGETSPVEPMVESNFDRRKPEGTPGVLGVEGAEGIRGPAGTLGAANNFPRPNPLGTPTPPALGEEPLA